MPRLPPVINATLPRNFFSALLAIDFLVYHSQTTHEIFCQSSTLAYFSTARARANLRDQSMARPRRRLGTGALAWLDRRTDTVPADFQSRLHDLGFHHVYRLPPLVDGRRAQSSSRRRLPYGRTRTLHRVGTVHRVDDFARGRHVCSRCVHAVFPRVLRRRRRALFQRTGCRSIRGIFRRSVFSRHALQGIARRRPSVACLCLSQSYFIPPSTSSNPARLIFSTASNPLPAFNIYS